MLLEQKRCKNKKVFRTYSSKKVDKNGATCNMEFGRITKIHPSPLPFPLPPFSTDDKPNKELRLSAFVQSFGSPHTYLRAHPNIFSIAPAEIRDSNVFLFTLNECQIHVVKKCHLFQFHQLFFHMGFKFCFIQSSECHPPFPTRTILLLDERRDMLSADGRRRDVFLCQFRHSDKRLV